MKKFKSDFLSLVFLGFMALGIFAAKSSLAAESDPANSRIDGVPVEAVEVFPDLKNHEISFGVGLFPFNAYYYGLSINAGYTYHFNNTFGWEVLHAEDYFSIDKGLTSELADKYKVNPRTIEQLRYTVSSDLMYVFLNGKFAFAKDHIRYFRSSVLLGPGLVNTSDHNLFAANFGARFEFFTGDSLSWKFEARDSLPIGGFSNILSFSLGTGIRF